MYKRQVYDLEKLTGRKNRKVPVPDFMVQMLKSIKERYQGNLEDFVLGNQAQEPVRVDRMRAALQRRSHMCGMETVTPRMLRDTYATVSYTHLDVYKRQDRNGSRL